jgi:predicted phosphodiesterase
MTGEMRVAIVSDIHGNRTAFEAVLADLRQTAPDLVLHGGDLADSGASPAEIVDRIRDLGWPGVLGNGEESLAAPASLEAFAGQSKAPASMWTAVREIMAATRALLGEKRIRWLGGLPPVHLENSLALVHASPGDPWRAPGPEAADVDLSAVYAPLQRAVAVYGHIHRPFIRRVPVSDGAAMVVANAGSVSLSYDGDIRAAYLLVDDSRPSVRRVEYDVEREARILGASAIPHADWVARMLRSGGPALP